MAVGSWGLPCRHSTAVRALCSHQGGEKEGMMCGPNRNAGSEPFSERELPEMAR